VLFTLCSSHQSEVASATKIHQELGGPDAGSLRSLQRILAKSKNEAYFCTGKEGCKLTQKRE
jgi:hypothetical protein